MADEQSGICCVWERAFKLRRARVFLQANRGCAANCLAQAVLGRSGVGAVLSYAICHMLQTIIKCIFSVVASRILAHEACGGGIFSSLRQL